jgi:hypothetical protein
MAALSRDENTGILRIHFRFGGKQFQKSLKTTEKVKAEAMKGTVEETLHDLERGRLAVPPEADFWVFVRSGGKLEAAPDLRKSLTLCELFDTYDDKLTTGAKEPSTRRVEKIHAEHLKRVMGSRRHLEGIRTGTLQEYIDQRAKEKWKGKRIKAQTIRKELDTLQTMVLGPREGSRQGEYPDW